MIPEEIFEIIIGTIELYKTCKSFYNHRKVFYKQYVADYKVLEKRSGFLNLKKISYNPDNIYRLKNSNGHLVFKNLTHLSLDRTYNEKLPNLPVLQQITHLTLGDCYHRPLPMLSNLTDLTMGYYYNQPLPLFPKLTNLICGLNYNQVLPLYSKLTHLIIKYYYNEILPELPNLTHLTIHRYKKPLPNLPKLEYLEFKDDYHLPLPYLPELKHLQFNHTYSQPLPLLSKLEYLEFYDYDFSVPDLPNLKCLKFGANYTHPIHLLNLEVLKIPESFILPELYLPSLKSIITITPQIVMQ
jgi:hypothetical protein